MGKTSTASKQKYNEKAYDRVALSVKKRHKAGVTGRCKVKRRKHNGYIKNAVQKQYKDDTGEEIEL